MMIKPVDINILIVEDEALSAMLLSRQLQSFGYQICAAVATGEKAISACQEKKIDLVLMDIRLAGAMDGIEAAEHIRKISKDKLLPIIFMTGYQDNAIRNQAMHVKPIEYLIKPIHAAFLDKAIQKYFQT